MLEATVSRRWSLIVERNLEAGLGEVGILRVEFDVCVERLVGWATGDEGEHDGTSAAE